MSEGRKKEKKVKHAKAAKHIKVTVGKGCKEQYSDGRSDDEAEGAVAGDQEVKGFTRSY